MGWYSRCANLTSTAPQASPYNSFWFNEDQKVLYVWDVDQWVKAAPDADVFEGMVPLIKMAVVLTKLVTLQFSKVC